jgi:hypothetical protein
MFSLYFLFDIHIFNPMLHNHFWVKASRWCNGLDDEIRFVLNQHVELDFYSASSLKQQSAGKHVDPLGHIILILKYC